jgi:hypothetical protein
MILDEMRDLPEPEINLLDPGRVERYVQATGWKREDRFGKGKVAVYERPESRSEQIRIPLSRRLPDFNLVLGQTVTLIARWEKRPALELLHELLLPPADLLCFRESGPGVGSIDVPLDHGLRLLAGVRKTLLAAACSVLRPEPWHPRTNLPQAEQFLQRCRLAQTTTTGFAVTVACLLDPGAGAEALSDPAPFSRRVTVLLMRSLHRLAGAFEAGDPDRALVPTAGAPVVSANLCEGLLEMMPEGEGAALTVTATWARTLPPSEESLPAAVRLRREDFPRLESLARQLHPAHEPQRQTFLGVVETLNGRRNAGGQVEGEVVVTVLDPEGETLRARADLDAASYAAAVEAHLRGWPVSLQGVLHRGVRTHRLEDVSEVKVYPRLAQQQESA